MTDLQRWAQQSFSSHNHMHSCTGLSWSTCKKLRTGSIDSIRQTTLKTARLVMEFMTTEDPAKVLLSIVHSKRLPYGWHTMIKIMARSIVAKHLVIQATPKRWHACFTGSGSVLDPCTTFFAELAKVESLLTAIYKRYPSMRDHLFRGTGFIELMKMYGENYRRLKRFKNVDISPANSLCEPLYKGENHENSKTRRRSR